MRVMVLALGTTALFFGGGAGWNTFRANGAAIKYPDHWHATSRALTPVTSPSQLVAVTSFSIPPNPAADGCRPTGVLARMQPRGAFVYVIEYAGDIRKSDFPPRPRRFRLTHLANYECFGRGYRLTFREAGRYFQAQLDFGRSATRATRATALRVLDSFTAR
jgi:hypothetical protein